MKTFLMLLMIALVFLAAMPVHADHLDLVSKANYNFSEADVLPDSNGVTGTGKYKGIDMSQFPITEVTAAADSIADSIIVWIDAKVLAAPQSATYYWQSIARVALTQEGKPYTISYPYTAEAFRCRLSDDDTGETIDLNFRKVK